MTIAKGVHPVPSRTRQLSPSAPMVVGAQAPARVGHRQQSSFCLTPPPSSLQLLRPCLTVNSVLDSYVVLARGLAVWQCVTRIRLNSDQGMAGCGRSLGLFCSCRLTWQAHDSGDPGGRPGHPDEVRYCPRCCTFGRQPMVLYAVETATAVDRRASRCWWSAMAPTQVRQPGRTRARYVVQEQQLGTGHAVLQARAMLAGQAELCW